MSRPIEIENSWSVKISFFKGVETFSTVEMSFFKVLRLSWQSRCPFSKCRDFLDSLDVLFQSVKIESLDRDKDKNWDKSRLYSINFVKICRDVIFQTVKNFSTVEMSFFKVSRKSRLLRLSIEIRSRQIETSTPNF